MHANSARPLFPRRVQDMLLEMRMVLSLAILLPVLARAADDPYAAEVFAKNCASCHQSEAGARGRIPQIDVLKTMTSTAIQKTLESGIMKTQAAPLSADERLKLATFLGITTTREKRREELANPCPAGVGWKGSSAFGTWGGDLANTRFQSAAAAGLRAEDVPRLKLAWAFAFPDTSTLRSQPAIYRGRVFAGGKTGRCTRSTRRRAACIGRLAWNRRCAPGW
jgi:polyvinyl alcohol dehydrogenase (cytochrome)